MEKITVRFATEEDAGLLDAMTTPCFDAPLDWTRATDGWLVAERVGLPLGVVQVCPMKPVGVLEHLIVAEGLTHRQRFETSMALCSAARKVLVSAGCQAAAAFTPFENKTAKKMFKKHFKGRVISSGNMLVMER